MNLRKVGKSQAMRGKLKRARVCILWTAHRIDLVTGSVLSTVPGDSARKMFLCVFVKVSKITINLLMLLTS